MQLMTPFGGLFGGMFGNMMGGMLGGGAGMGVPAGQGAPQVYSYSSSTVMRSGPDGTYHSSTTSRQAPGGVGVFCQTPSMWRCVAAATFRPCMQRQAASHVCNALHLHLHAVVLIVQTCACGCCTHTPAGT